METRRCAEEGNRSQHLHKRPRNNNVEFDLPVSQKSLRVPPRCLCALRDQDVLTFVRMTEPPTRKPEDPNTQLVALLSIAPMTSGRCNRV